MFDVYLHAHSGAPDRRLRLLVSATTAVALTGATLIGWGLLQRLQIEAVAAAEHAPSLTVILPRSAPPAPAPPKAPASSPDTAAAAGSEVSPARRTPSAAPAESDEAPATPSVARREAGVPGAGPPGLGRHPGLMTTPAGGCVVPPCGERRVHDAGQEPARVMAPLSSLRAKGRFTPDPDVAALARTRTARTTRRSGAVAVEFCVEPAGTTSGVRIERSFGDPQVDAIATATVRRWRFDPSRVGGQKVRTCSQVTFRIQFE